MKLQPKTIEKLRKLINEEIVYRTGPALVNFFNEMGFSDQYGQGFPSRWVYTEENIKKINGTDKIEECVKKLFAPVNFIEHFDQLDKHIADFNQYLAFDDLQIQRQGKDIRITNSKKEFSDPIPPITEDDFLNREFKAISVEKLNLDIAITTTLKQRFDEIQKCLKAKASLAVIFLCGSTLEGILLGTAIKYPQKFNQANGAPKDKSGKIFQFHEWNLNSLIEVSKEIGLLGEDVKKFSHALRDFRNYIHPYQQASSNFNTDEHTAKICWQVLKAAIDQLSK